MQTKRLLSILLALALCLGLLPVGMIHAAAEDAAPAVIEISSADELKKIGNDPDYPLSGSYKLTKDINLGGKADDNTTWWTPIGIDYNTPFAGTFDNVGQQPHRAAPQRK